MKKLISVMLLLSAIAAHAAVKTETVQYKEGKAVLEGYLTYDDAQTGKRPAVIVAHEWWGNGPYSKMRAEQLAKLGYVGFACDIYGKGVHASNHEEAGKLSGMYKNDRTLLRSRMKAALEVLQKDPRVDASRIAAVGYCFGGSGVLEMARAGMPVVGVATFHGALDSPTPAQGHIAAKVIAFQGADDAFTLPAVAGFVDEMKKSGADWQMVYYSGAVHSFTVPEAGNDNSKGMAYNENADKRSWIALQNFLQEVFK